MGTGKRTSKERETGDVGIAVREFIFRRYRAGHGDRSPDLRQCLDAVYDGIEFFMLLPSIFLIPLLYKPSDEKNTPRSYADGDGISGY